MPRINPIHLRRVSPITLSGRGQGNINLSAGTIASPRAANPAHIQFIGRDTQIPLVLGKEAAGLAETVNEALIRHAKRVAIAEGQEKANAFIQEQDTQFMGTPDQDPKTIPAFQSGKAFVKASGDYLQEYDNRRGQIAKSLDPAARLVFIQKTDGHRHEIYNRIQGRRYKEQLKYIQDQQKVEEALKIKLIGDKAFRVFSEMKTLLPEEIKARTTELDTEIAAEATRKAKALGMPAPLALDTTIYKALQDIYSRDEGDAVASLVEDRWISSITDSKIREKAEKLHANYITRQYALLKAANDYAQAEDEYDYRQREKGYVNQLSGLDHKGDAQVIVQKAFAHSTYEGQKVAALAKAFTSIETENPENSTFAEFARIKGWSPSKAALVASQQGISLTKKQITEIAKTWPSNIRHLTKDYLDRFTAEFQHLMNAQSGLAFDFAAIMSGKKAGANNPAVRQFRSWRSELQKGIENTLIAGKDPDDFYNKFVASRLNPDKVSSSFLKFTPKDSVVPVGIFKNLPWNNTQSYLQIGGLITRTGVLSESEKKAVIKLATAADSYDEKVKARAVNQLGKIYRVAQSRIFKKTGQTDMYEEWMHEVPFQWYAIRSHIGDIK